MDEIANANASAEDAWCTGLLYSVTVEMRLSMLRSEDA